LSLWLFDWLICDWGQDLTVLTHLGELVVSLQNYHSKMLKCCPHQMMSIPECIFFAWYQASAMM
jgi:hypothetical protein